MKCLFVINPVSGTQAFHKSLNTFIGDLILQTKVDHVDTFFTKGNNDAFERCRAVKKGEYDFIVSVGGDGTVNECLGGIIKSGSETPVALIPAGTVNDFANYLNLPLKSQPFVDIINDFHTEKIDVGEVQGKIFANVVAGGMFSDIAFQVKSKDKNTWGPLAYYIAGFSQLPQQLAMNLHLKITADEAQFEEDASLFLVANSQSVGGFKGITPIASVEDGKLDLLIIKKSNVAELLNALKDLAIGKLLDNSRIDYVQASNIHIECDKDILYDVDGEEGSTFPLEIKCLHQAINLIMPKSN
jgi:diacylglycerol kinase (ATP)